VKFWILPIRPLALSQESIEITAERIIATWFYKRDSPAFSGKPLMTSAVPRGRQVIAGEALPESFHLPESSHALIGCASTSTGVVETFCAPSVSIYPDDERAQR
jgi:hypothetical protein